MRYGYAGEPANNGFALQGCLLSILIWFFASLLLLATQASDCFDKFGCQAAQHVARLAIIFGAIALNLLGLFLVTRAKARSGEYW